MQHSDLNRNRVAIYLRVSTSEQARDGYSIGAQNYHLVEAMKKQGKTIVKEYIDAGISGSSLKKRKGMQSLLKDAELGLFDEVVVWKLSRVSRKFSDLLTIVSHLENCNVQIRSITEDFDSSTPKGKFMLHMLGSVAELEVKGTGENIRNSSVKRVKQGFVHGHIPFGYRKNDSNCKLEVFEPEARLVRRIFELYYDGNGYKKIAIRLLDEGIRTSGGKRYSPASIHRMLTRVVYNGYSTIKDKKTKMTVIAKGEFEPIISDDLWFGVQQIMAKKRKPRKEAKAYILNGLLLCPRCSNPMYVRVIKRKRQDGSVKLYHYYECSHSLKYGKVCSGRMIPKEHIENVVTSELMATFQNTDFINDLVQRINQKCLSHQSTKGRSLADIKRDQKELNMTLKQLFEAFENDSISSGEFSTEVEAINAKLLAVEEEIIRFDHMNHERESKVLNREDVGRLLRDVLVRFDEKNHTKIRQMLKLLVSKIEVVNADDFSKVSIAFNKDAMLFYLRKC